MRLCSPDLNIISFGESLCTDGTLTNACSTTTVSHVFREQLATVIADSFWLFMMTNRACLDCRQVVIEQSSGVVERDGSLEALHLACCVGFATVASTRACLDYDFLVDRILTIMMSTNVLNADASPPMIDHSLGAVFLDPAVVFCSPQNVHAGQDVHFCGLASPA